jgi:Protein of unknown function (DUF1579)
VARKADQGGHHGPAPGPTSTSAAPEPDPALKRLERLGGTWNVTGRTIDSEQDNVSGRFTFEWLPGGFFLQQRTELNFAGYQVQGLEVIGYDPATDRFPSTVYASMVGVPIPSEYDLQGDQVTIRTELNGGATYRGSFSADGNPGSGGWRPDPGQDLYNTWAYRSIVPYQQLEFIQNFADEDGTRYALGQQQD